jgi:hypothetical protein
MNTTAQLVVNGFIILSVQSAEPIPRHNKMQQCGYCKHWFKNYKDLSGHLDTCKVLDEYLEEEHQYSKKLSSVLLEG